MVVLDSDALALLLQHPSISQQPQLVCRLLCTCKPLRAAIALHLRGQVPVKFAPRTRQPIDSFGAWLASTGRIVQSLDLDLQLLADYRHAAAHRTAALAAIATGLHKAAAAATEQGGTGWWSSLQLQSYISSATSGAILQVLPASSNQLTRLDPGASFDPLQTFGPYSSTGLPRRALAALTALRQLALRGIAADKLLPAVPGLACLTQLYLSEISMSSVPQLQHLPVQLKSLWLTTAVPQHNIQAAMQLAHLTALTELSIDLDLDADDVLPANIEVLQMANRVSGNHSLTQLRVLKLTSCTPPGDQLLQLAGSSSQLTEVALTYVRGMDYVNAAVAAWPALPLRWLDIDGCSEHLPASVVQQLSKLQGLTSLVISAVTVDAAVLPQLAASLGQLTNLKDLQLSNIQVQAPPGADEDFMEDGWDSYAPLMQAVAGLQQLRQLTLSDLYLSEEEAAMLAAATQLTSLQLTQCGLLEFSIYSIACSLSGLRELDISSLRAADGAMPVIAKDMPHLTKLALNSNAITDRGIRALSRLCGLKCLELGGNTGLTDRGVAAIAAHLTQLTRLNLQNTNISSSGLVCLSNLRRLEQLDVGGTRSRVSVKAWLQALRRYVPRGDGGGSGSEDEVGAWFSDAEGDSSGSSSSSEEEEGSGPEDEEEV